MAIVSDLAPTAPAASLATGASARLAAERLENPAQLEPLRKINRTMEVISGLDVEGFAQYLSLNEVFHLAIFDLAKSQALRRAVDQIYRFPFVAPSGRVILRQTGPGWNAIRPIAEEHHRGLVDAIEHREGGRAESLAREHGRITRRHLEEALADRSFLETIPGARLIKVQTAGRI